VTQSQQIVFRHDILDSNIRNTQSVKIESKNKEEMNMKQIRSNEFQNEVLESNIPVLVDFAASWCGPCRMMGPVLEQLSAEYEGKAKIVKVDIDESMDLAQKYQIMSVPNMIIFKGGAPVDAVVGAVPPAYLKEKLDKFV